MNKSTIIERVSSNLHMRKNVVEEVMTEVFGVIQEALIEGEKVSIANLGSFTPSISPAREQRTALNGGGVLQIAPNGKVNFKASDNLKKAIAEEGQATVRGAATKRSS